LLAYCINLDSRTDRRAFMEAQFEAIGLDVERLQATTPETIDAEDMAPLAMKDVGRRLSPPEIAVSISHFRAWKGMLDRGRRHVLVIEDDMLLSRRLPAFLSALDSGTADIGILRLETHQTQVRIHPQAEPVAPGFALHLPLSFESGAGAYVISAASAARILSSPKRFAMALDDLLFSLESPFRDRSNLRVTVPALALYRFEATPEFDVPASILASDAHHGRLSRSALARANKPTGSRRIGREIVRLKRQLAAACPALWARLVARTTVVPFADSEVSEQPSAAPPRA
jgi:glycosyl transferase family 25